MLKGFQQRHIRVCMRTFELVELDDVSAQYNEHLHTHATSSRKPLSFNKFEMQKGYIHNAHKPI